MSLVGMTPPEIMQASETALNFWVDQKVFESQQDAKRQTVLGERYKKTEELVKERLVESENACNALQEERRGLELRIEEAERDNAKAANQLRELEREYTAAEEEYRSLHSRVSHGDFRTFFRRSFPDASPMKRNGTEGRAGTPSTRSGSSIGGGATAGSSSRNVSSDPNQGAGRDRQAWSHSGTPYRRSNIPIASPGSFLAHRAVSASKADHYQGSADRRGGGAVLPGVGSSDGHRRGDEGGRPRGDGHHGGAGAQNGIGAALGAGVDPGHESVGLANRFGSSSRRLPIFTPGMSYGPGRFAKKRTMK